MPSNFLALVRKIPFETLMWLDLVEGILGGVASASRLQAWGMYDVFDDGGQEGGPEQGNA